MSFRTQKKSEQIRDGNVREVDIDFGLNVGQVNAQSNPTDTINFDLNLSTADDTVQKALDTLDDIDFEALAELVFSKTDYDEFVYGSTESGSIGEYGWTKYNIKNVLEVDYVDPEDRIGVIRLKTNNKTNNGGTLSTPSYNSFRSQPTLTCRTSIKLGANIVESTFWIGFHDQRTGFSDPTHGIYFKFNQENSGNLFAVTSAQNSRTEVNTGYTVTANTWMRLEIQVNDTNDSVEFFIDGNSVAIINTNIPDQNGQYFGPAITILSRDNNYKELYIDYYSLKYPILDR